PPPHLESDVRQRTLRRAARRDAGAEVEPALMTRTIETVLALSRHDGARKLRALLAECHELVRRQPHEQTRLVFVRIGEYHCAADRDVVHRCKPLHGQGAALTAI